MNSEPHQETYHAPMSAAPPDKVRHSHGDAWCQLHGARERISLGQFLNVAFKEEISMPFPERKPEFRPFSLLVSILFRVLTLPGARLSE